MRIYYFVHTVGRDLGNSGIPRVSRNLARVLEAMADVELVPVRWDEATSSIAHVEPSFCEVMRMHGGPDLRAGGAAGTAIHHDRRRPDAEVPWLLVPEVPHLGAREGGLAPTHLAHVAGYARLHGMRLAAIFHDAMPITHFGEQNSSDPVALAFTIYAMALASFDVVLPVSQSSGDHLISLFERYGLEWKPRQILRPLLLPEELVGSAPLRFLDDGSPRSGSRHEFCMWGTIFPHKNQLAVMEAFNRLCLQRPDLDLVLNHVGSIDARCVEPVRFFVRRSQGRIRLHGFVDDKELMTLIGRARATLFVSRAEGYGLPLAESLWLGRPCITSNRAPMTEIAAGGGAVLVDPKSIDEIAGAMERIVTDDSFYADLLAQLRQRSMRTWQEYGDEVLATLKLAGKAEAAAAEKPIYFMPARRQRDKLRIECFLFGVDDLDIDRELEERGATRRARGILEYRPRKAVSSREAAQQPFVERAICYGPYHTIGSGELRFDIEGEVQGKCRVLVTSEEGRQIHFDAERDSFDDAILIPAPHGLEKLEVVFRTTESLSYLRIESVTLTRWYD